MRVWIDPVRLAARGVTATEVLTAINDSNFLSAPGKTQNEFVAYSITMRTTLQTPEAFGALPLRSEGDKVVRLRDVARVELAPRNRHEASPSTASPAPSSASSRRRRPTRSTPPRRWSPSCRRSRTPCRKA